METWPTSEPFEAQEDTYLGDFPVACRILPPRFRWTIVRTSTENKALLDDVAPATRHFPTGIARICDADVAAFTSGDPDKAFLARDAPGPLGSRALSLAPNELLFEEFRRAAALGMTLPYGPAAADREIAVLYVRYALGVAEEKSLAAQRRNLERSLQSINGSKFATAMPSNGLEELRLAMEKASCLRRYRESDEVCSALAAALAEHDRPLNIPSALSRLAAEQAAEAPHARPSAFEEAAMAKIAELRFDLAMARADGMREGQEPPRPQISGRAPAREPADAAGEARIPEAVWRLLGREPSKTGDER